MAANVIADTRRDIVKLRSLITGGGDAPAIREALSALETSAYRIAECMYGEAKT